MRIPERILPALAALLLPMASLLFMNLGMQADPPIGTLIVSPTILSL